MPADFQINLAKDLTSSPEERIKFYNGMLIYLVSSAAILVTVAYFTSMNLMSFIENKSEQKQLRTTAVAVSDINMDDFKNPEDAYLELKAHSIRLSRLKQQLGTRVQLLPVIHNLLIDLPQGVGIESLAANRSKLTFGMTMPEGTGELGDPVRDLTETWEKNEELMERVSSIRPITGERRTVGKESIFYVQFECILKK